MMETNIQIKVGCRTVFPLRIGLKILSISRLAQNIDQTLTILKVVISIVVVMHVT